MKRFIFSVLLIMQAIGISQTSRASIFSDDPAPEGHPWKIPFAVHKFFTDYDGRCSWVKKGVDEDLHDEDITILAPQTRDSFGNYRIHAASLRCDLLGHGTIYIPRISCWSTKSYRTNNPNDGLAACLGMKNKAGGIK